MVFCALFDCYHVFFLDFRNSVGSADARVFFPIGRLAMTIRHHQFVECSLHALCGDPYLRDMFVALAYAMYPFFVRLGVCFVGNRALSDKRMRHKGYSCSGAWYSQSRRTNRNACSVHPRNFDQRSCEVRTLIPRDGVRAVVPRILRGHHAIACARRQPHRGMALVVERRSPCPHSTPSWLPQKCSYASDLLRWTRWNWFDGITSPWATLRREIADPSNRGNGVVPRHIRLSRICETIGGWGVFCPCIKKTH